MDEAEKKFLRRLQARDERAFNELVELYEQRIFTLVLRMVGRREEAEDLAQEVFVQVFKGIGQFRGDAQIGTWIYRIAINLCKNRTSYLARRRTQDQDEFEAAAERADLRGAQGVTAGELATPDQTVQGYQLERIIVRAIQDLDPEQREILILRDVEDLSYEEILEITGLNAGTLKSRLHRARAALKQKVSQVLGEKIR